MSSFQEFINNNGIIATTAGITIGFATASFVKSFVADVILPVIFLALVRGTGKVSSGTSSFFSKFLSNKEFMFANFTSELITWILIVLVAWLVLDLAYKYLAKNHHIINKITNPFGGARQESEHMTVSQEAAAKKLHDDLYRLQQQPQPQSQSQSQQSLW